MYQKGIKVFFTKYSLNRIIEISMGGETSIEAVISEGEYSSPSHDGYHSVWIEKDKVFETVSDRDLHLTRELASRKVLEDIQFRKNYVTAQMDRLNHLEGLFNSFVC